MEEIWKDITDHSDYQISNLGRVKIKPRSYTDKIGVFRKYKEKILIPNKKWGVYIDGHAYKIETLMLRYFPEKLIEYFINNHTLSWSAASF